MPINRTEPLQEKWRDDVDAALEEAKPAAVDYFLDCLESNPEIRKEIESILDDRSEVDFSDREGGVHEVRILRLGRDDWLVNGTLYFKRGNRHLVHIVSTIGPECESHGAPWEREPTRDS